MELRGAGVSPGIAVGAALVIERERVPVFRLMVAPAGVEAEVQRLEQAVRVSRGQLQGIKQRLARATSLPHAYIFEAQALMLDDPLLVARAIAVIRDEHVNAEWAVRVVGERLQQQFDEFTDAYLRERRTDVFDVLGRIQLNLSGEGAPSLSRLPGSFVLVAADLTPSEAAELDWERVLAVALDAGSPTYHTSILARSFGVPAVVGLAQATRCVPPGALVVVDGSAGQYLLAVDRVDPRVASLYQPLHPAVLRVIRGVVLAAEKHQRPVSLCGEMATNPLQCLALLGLGIRELSLAPVAIPRIKQTLRAVRADTATATALACLDLPDAASVSARLHLDLGAAIERSQQPRAKE